MTHEDIEATKAPLIEHLIELRSRLIKAMVAFFVMLVVCFFFAKQIFNILTWPYVWVAGADNAKFIYTGLLEYSVVQLKLAMFGAAFLSFPVVAAQLYMFVAPGLYRTACGKGYMDCYPGEPREVNLRHDGLDYFNSDRVASLFYWSEAAARWNEAGDGTSFQHRHWLDAWYHAFDTVTPLIAMRKAEIVRLGLELGAPFDLTWSCYSREDRACGVCDSCVLRRRAFEAVGIQDPIPYAVG